MSLYLINQKRIIEYNIESNEYKTIDDYTYETLIPLNFGYAKVIDDYTYRVLWFTDNNINNTSDIEVPIRIYESKSHILGNAIHFVSHAVIGINILNIPEKKSLTVSKAKSITKTIKADEYMTINKLCYYVYHIDIDKLIINTVDTDYIDDFTEICAIDRDDILCYLISESFGKYILTLVGRHFIWYDLEFNRSYQYLDYKGNLLYKNIYIVGGKVIIAIITGYQQNSNTYNFVYLFNVNDNYIEEHIITDVSLNVYSFHIDRYGFLINYVNLYYYQNSIECYCKKDYKYAFMMNNSIYYNKRITVINNTINLHINFKDSLSKIIADY